MQRKKSLNTILLLLLTITLVHAQIDWAEFNEEENIFGKEDTPVLDLEELLTEAAETNKETQQNNEETTKEKTQYTTPTLPPIQEETLTGYYSYTLWFYTAIALGILALGIAIYLLYALLHKTKNRFEKSKPNKE